MASDRDRIVDFIKAAKARGAADDFIASLLRHHGWPDRRIYGAFAEHYEADLGMPVPSRGSGLELARDAFFHLLAFIMLGTWTAALVLFADAYIDHAIPSALDNTYFASAFRSQVAADLASMIVSFPLFLFVGRIMAREVARRPDAFDSGARKWLTYIALVIAAVFLVSDAVFFLTTYLTGDLTARFAWKAAVLFAVAGGVFWYYLGQVRAEAPDAIRDRAFGAAAIVAVAAALVLGFAAVGGPGAQRHASFDQLRVARLSSIAAAIHDDQTALGRIQPPQLRRTLDAVPDLNPADMIDPETGARFAYIPGNGASYRLCATFDLADAQLAAPMWNHAAGRACFSLDATREVQRVFAPAGRD